MDGDSGERGHTAPATNPGWSPPWASRPRTASSELLDSTDPLLRCDRAEPLLWKDRNESVYIDEPIDRVEFSDQSDHTRAT